MLTHRIRARSLFWAFAKHKLKKMLKAEKPLSIRFNNLGFNNIYFCNQVFTTLIFNKMTLWFNNPWIQQWWILQNFYSILSNSTIFGFNNQINIFYNPIFNNFGFNNPWIQQYLMMNGFRTVNGVWVFLYLKDVRWSELRPRSTEPGLHKER